MPLSNFKTGVTFWRQCTTFQSKLDKVYLLLVKLKGVCGVSKLETMDAFKAHHRIAPIKYNGVIYFVA